MRYIKFNTIEEAQAVADRVFAAAYADGKFVIGTTAYAIPEQEEYFTIPVLEGFDQYFTNQELSGADAFKEEKQGRLVIDDMIYQLRNVQALTVAQRVTLLTYLRDVQIQLIVGELRVAREIANGLATTALYTNARKTWVVARIDTEIALL